MLNNSFHCPTGHIFSRVDSRGYNNSLSVPELAGVLVVGDQELFDLVPCNSMAKSLPSHKFPSVLIVHNSVHKLVVHCISIGEAVGEVY